VDIKFPQKLDNGPGDGNRRAIKGSGRRAEAKAPTYRLPKKLTVDDTFENANFGVRFAQILNGEDGDPQPPKSVSPTPAPGECETDIKEEDDDDVQLSTRATSTTSVATGTTHTSVRSSTRSRSSTAALSTAPSSASVPPSTRASSRLSSVAGRHMCSASRATSAATATSVAASNAGDDDAESEFGGAEGAEKSTRVGTGTKRTRSGGRDVKRARR
jgi:hypothetical protein